MERERNETEAARSEMEAHKRPGTNGHNPTVKKAGRGKMTTQCDRSINASRVKANGSGRAAVKRVKSVSERARVRGGHGAKSAQRKAARRDKDNSR